MKNYVNTMSTLLDILMPAAECRCYYDYELDEEFLCDLCAARLKNHRSKLKRKLRRESKQRHKKHENT